MTDQRQEDVDTISAIACAVVSANTDPESGQMLQPADAVAPQSLKADQYLEKLLSRVRSDSVYELRKLRHQHRPVSDFASKKTLEELLGKRHQNPSPLLSPDLAAAVAGPCDEEPGSEVEKRVKQLSTISQDNAATASPQEHMPPSVRLEIRGLFEQQQVSGFLGSAHASDIERTLQEGIERRRSRQQRRRARPLPGHAQGGRGGLLAEIRGQVGGNSQARREDRANGPPRQPENGQYPIPRRDQGSIVRQLQDSPALNSLQPAERDRVLTEVTDLVQQHLVSSALAGEFRGILELHIQNRADQIRDGATGEDVGRSLQRRSNRSAPTFAARSFDPDEPSSASMSEMRQELREMKSQMLELKQLMRTSFDLQLDIQRAIRQEVAAALSSACTPPSTLSQPSVPAAVGSGRTMGRSSVAVDSGNCVICSEASINSVVYRCGHMCVCMQCGLELKAQGLKCPICRAPITDIIRAYSSMQ